MIAVMVCMVLLLQMPTVLPQEEQPAANPAQIRHAVEKGLAFLAREQRPDGSWICKIGYKLNNGYIGDDGEHVGVTALACMAFMANGHMPGRGQYGKVVAKGLEFVLGCVNEDTGYVSKNGTRMYEHAFATMFLAEIYGMAPKMEIKRKLKMAVRRIIDSQNDQGGWRYSPMPVDADISVTVSTLQALRAARNAGIDVPKRTIDKGMGYIKKCAKSQGFEYQISDHNGLDQSRSSYPLNAAGVVSFYSAGDYHAQEVEWGLQYLERSRNELRWNTYHYFYGHYYGVQAMYQAKGTYWDNYWPAVSREIVSQQMPEGYWVDDVGRNFATAMACLIMQIPNEYLPIFQK